MASWSKEVVGDGNAGNITVRSGSTFVMQNSSMTTEATQASGGQIDHYHSGDGPVESQQNQHIRCR